MMVAQTFSDMDDCRVGATDQVCALGGGRTAILGSRRLSQWFYRVGRSAPGARTDFLGMDDCRTELQLKDH